MTVKTAITTMFISLLVITIPTLANADVSQKYQESCAACHDSGALNAPKTGDTMIWQKLKSQKGMPALVDSVKNGMPQMPAGGLCKSCTDAEYRALIEYMAN